MEKITTEYKGYTIVYENTWDGEMWVVKDDKDHDAYKNKSLKAVEKYIDGLSKKDFKTFEVYHKEHWGHDYEKATVTSITEDGEYWIRNEKGKREKCNPKCLLYISEANDILLADIKAVKSKQDDLYKQKDVLENKLKYYKKGGN